MIAFEEAYDIVMGRARPLLTEEVELAGAGGRVLGQDIIATADIPPFDRAMVDGYACRRDNLAQTLKVVETVQAGKPPTKILGPGECAKVMTGATVPEGADCAFMVEHSDDQDGCVRFTGEKTNDNIALRASDAKRGEILLFCGHRLSPPDLAVLASMGYVHPRVSCRPHACVIATGDELVEPDMNPGPAQIRNSNASQIYAQLQSAGAQPAYGGIAGDTEESITRRVSLALKKNDVVILSGGVSMGDYDLVPGVLDSMGFETHFRKIAMQPGKPTVFASSGSQYIFGLPGNPVATFVVFETLVRPFLLKLMGHAYKPPNVVMPVGEPFVRKSGARPAWVPVRLTEDGHVAPVKFHGSGHYHALSYADGLTRFPEGETELAKGRQVHVRLIRL